MSRIFAKTIYASITSTAAMSLLTAYAAAAQIPESPKSEQHSKHHKIDTTSRINEIEIDLSKRAKKISFKQAVTTALLNSPRPLQAYKNYQAAAWTAISTKRKWRPTLTGSITAGSSGSRFELNQLPKGAAWERELTLREASNLKPKINLNWSIFNLSRTSILNSQELATQSSSVAVRSSIRDLILRVQESYYKLQELRELENTYQLIYEICMSQYNRLRQIAKTSKTNSSEDYPDLETRALEALTLRVLTQQQVINASSTLAAEIGLAEDSFVLPSETLEPHGKWTLGLEESLENALKLNDNITIADLNASTIYEEAKSKRLEYAPEISLEAKASYENEQFSIGNSASPDIRTARGLKSDYSIGAILKWKMFDSGVLAASASSLYKQASALEMQAKSERLDTARQVKSAYGEYTSQLILLPQTEEQFRAAERALTQTQNSATTSDSYQTEFIQAIGQYQSAKINNLASIERYNTSIARLHNKTATWPEWVIPLIKSSIKFVRNAPLITKQN